MKIGNYEIDEKAIVKGKAKPFTEKQAKEMAKDFNGMVNKDNKKKKENEQFRNWVNKKD